MTGFIYRLYVATIVLSISGLWPAVDVLAQQAPPQAELPAGITIDFNLVRACLLPQGQPTALSLAGVVGTSTTEQRRLGRVNVKCDHKLLMAQGIGLHRLTQRFVEIKKEIAEGQIGNSPNIVLLKHFAMDGTCLLSDVVLADPAKTANANATQGWAQCLRRLEFAESEAAFKMREEALRLDDARQGLSPNTNQLQLVSLAGVPDRPKEKITKDVVALRVKQSTGNQPAPQTQRILHSDELIRQGGTVDFNTPSAALNAVVQAKQGSLYGSQKVAINEKDELSRSVELEVTDRSTQAGFAKSVGKLDSKKLMQAQQLMLKDAKATIDAIKQQNYIQQMRDPTTRKLEPLIGELAYNQLIDELVLAAKKKEAGGNQQAMQKLSDDVVNKFDVDVTIAPSARKPGSTSLGSSSLSPGAKSTATPAPEKSLDETIQDQVKDVENAIQNIKSDAPY